MIAYDMDGVIASGPGPSAKTWGKMTGPERKARLEEYLHSYIHSSPLYVPTEESFCIISARKNTPDVRAATEEWLRKHYSSRVKGVYLLEEARQGDKVIRFKASVLEAIKATDFTEDNRAIVRGLVKQKLTCRIWLYKNGERILQG